MRNGTATLCRWVVAAAALLGACGLVSGAPLSAAQGRKLFGLGGDKGVTYQTFKDPAGRFEFDYPTKDWRELSSASLAMVSRNDRTTLVVDFSRMALAFPVTTEMAFRNLAEVEIDSLKERNPQAKEFTSEIVDTKGGHGALIRYASVGTKGPETIIHYSLPVGLDLYRVIAIVPKALLPKHEAVLMRMIDSFKSASAPVPKA